MKVLQVILGLLALVCVTEQSCHYSYWLWLEPRSAALAMSGDPVARDLAQSHTLEELDAMYEDVRRKADHPQDVTPRKPTVQEEQLKTALAAREAYEKQTFGLHYFWWVGLACIVTGVAFYVVFNRWLGMGFIIAGFLEMMFWMSPSWTSTGMEVEAERLLTGKLIYSTMTIGLLVGLWICAVAPALKRWRGPMLWRKELNDVTSAAGPRDGNGSKTARHRWRGPQRGGVAGGQDRESLS